MNENVEFADFAENLLKYEKAFLVEENRKSQSSGSDVQDETRDVLNTILPIKTWEKNNQLWRQEVSTVPSTRNDVINLQEKLDMFLEQRQARETGLCSIRRILYSQCFDELIRQVALNCIERGVLLARIRDEIKMTIHAYQTLYCSSIAYGIRKSLLAEQQNEDFSTESAGLKVENGDLKQQITDLNMKIEQLDRHYTEIQQNDEKRHQEEVQFLRKSNQQLKNQLEGIIAPKK